MAAMASEARDGRRGLKRRADEIADAAASVFAKRGYHGASTQDIADVLGIRQASLYYYFRSKEEALELVCDRGVEGFVERHREIAEGDGAPVEKLERLIASHLVPLQDRNDYVRVFLNERRYLPGPARRRIGRKSRRVERLFQAVIEAGIADGSMRPDLDARLSALAVLGMCNGAAAWYGREQGLTIPAIAAGLASLVVDGVKAPVKAA